MIEIRKISITELDTDAVVNAANEGLRAGSGVCGAGQDALRRIAGEADDLRRGKCRFRLVNGSAVW